MTDIALVWDAENSRADFRLAHGGLLIEEGLRTAVIISLMTDATARDDDDIADGDVPASADRRGWWGDMPLLGEAVRPIGSRLWLLRRAKATEGTRLRATTMAREALAWMAEDGICQRVEVEVELQGSPSDRLMLGITLRRGSGSPRFDIPWLFEGVS